MRRRLISLLLMWLGLFGMASHSVAWAAAPAPCCCITAPESLGLVAVAALREPEQRPVSFGSPDPLTFSHAIAAVPRSAARSPSGTPCLGAAPDDGVLTYLFTGRLRL